MLFLLVILLAALTAAQKYSRDVISALSGQSQATNITTYLGLFPTLVTQINAGNITVLAPSDTAFAKYWNSSQVTSDDTDHLEALLTYHLLQGVHADVFLDVAPKFIPTLLENSSYSNVTGGQRVEIVSSGGHVNYYSAAKAVSHLVTPNILFTKGVINIIDTVLTPPVDIETTANKVNLAGIFAILAGASPNPLLFGAAGETSDWTIFITNTTQARYLNVTQQQLFEFEEYACVQGEVAYSSMLTDGKTLQTLLGSNLTITVRDGSIYVNAAKVVEPDYLLSNGVLHVIDSALDPNNTSGPPLPTVSSSPTPMPQSSPHSSLGTGTKAGIGIAAGLGGLAVISILVCYSYRKRKRAAGRPQPEIKERPLPPKLSSPSELPQGTKRWVSELEGPGRVVEIG